MIIATRQDTDPHGNRYEETVVRVGDDAFRLEVRSDDPADCFDAILDLQELLEYTRAAVKPFLWTVIVGGLAA
jgi:hypothetical protein